MQIEQHTFSVFVGVPQQPAAGNACTLVLYSQRPENGLRPTESAAGGVHCHSWPAAASGQYHIECYQESSLINCCGHGLLAMAEARLPSATGATISFLVGNSGVLAFRRRGLTWLSFPRLYCQFADLPDWFAALGQAFTLAAEPIRYASAGGPHGYDIFEWPDNFPLQTLPRPGPSLGQYSQRAMIVTAKQTNDACSDVHFRYFAPQYGVEEDAATGSAMRVLVDYWAGEFDSLTALQCSAQGGVLMGAPSADRVEVGGVCQRQGQQI